MRSLRSSTLALVALAVLIGCGSQPTDPGTNPDVGVTDTVTVYDTTVVHDTTVVTKQLVQVKLHGYVTPIPDRNFCRYAAPIPADTTKRHWFCFYMADTTQHYVPSWQQPTPIPSVP